MCIAVLPRGFVFTRFVKDRLPSVVLNRGPDKFKEPPFIATMSPPIEAVLLLNLMKGLLLVPVTVPPLMASRSFPAVMVPPTSLKRGAKSDKFAPDSTLKISPAAVMTLGSESRSVPLIVASAPELTRIRLVPLV